MTLMQHLKLKSYIPHASTQVGAISLFLDSTSLCCVFANLNFIELFIHGSLWIKFKKCRVMHI